MVRDDRLSGPQPPTREEREQVEAERRRRMAPLWKAQDLARETAKAIDEISMNDDEAWIREDDAGAVTRSERYRQYSEALEHLGHARRALGEQQ